MLSYLVFDHFSRNIYILDLAAVKDFLWSYNEKLDAPTFFKLSMYLNTPVGSKSFRFWPDFYLWKKNFRGLSYLYQIRAKSYDHVWPEPYLPIKDYLPILLRGIYKEIGENIGKTCSAVHFRLTIGWNNFSKRIIIFLHVSKSQYFFFQFEF